MKRYITFISLIFLLSGCADLATQITGTFVGNIMADKAIKEMDKQDKGKK